MKETDEQLWDAVDAYFEEHLARADDVFEDVLRRSEAAGLPAIGVTAAQGKFLHLLAAAQAPRRILEVGTLGGYSAVWLARALVPGGRLTTIEFEPTHAEVARETFRRAGVAEAVDLRVGSALDVLPAIAGEPDAAFDFVFIDADKPNTPAYFDWAVRLCRPGSLIVVDNVVREGELADASNDDPRVVGMRRLVEQAGADRRVSATGIQTVGSKGYDGFLLARVLPPAH